jgi:hypothetical protein
MASEKYQAGTRDLILSQNNLKILKGKQNALGKLI